MASFLFFLSLHFFFGIFLTELSFSAGAVLFLSVSQECSKFGTPSNILLTDNLVNLQLQSVNVNAACSFYSEGEGEKASSFFFFSFFFNRSVQAMTLIWQRVSR